MARQALEYPWPFRILRLMFPVLETVLPSGAHALAVRLFLTPIKFPMRDADRKGYDDYKSTTITNDDISFTVYERGEGPAVMCLHGWSGHAMQFRLLADQLVKDGFKVILIDAPAHGRSSGGRSNLFEFASAFKHVLDTLRDPVAVIGHSLGAASISFAISEGVKVPAFISMGAPMIAKDILDEFCRRINGSERTAEGIKQRSIKEFGRTFESVAMESTYAAVKCPTLIIHGKQDLDVPFSHAEHLKGMKPDSQMQLFEEMGHRRILKDEKSLAVVLEWVKGRVSSEEL